MTVERAIRSFAIEGELLALEPLARGHINRTFVSTWSEGGSTRRYLHQRINDCVFADVACLMRNVERVTRRLGDVLAEPRQAPALAGFEALELIPTRAGATWLELDGAQAGVARGPWRTYRFIEGSEAFDRCTGPEQAFEVARIFGWFQGALRGLDPLELAPTIPDFFSPGHRLRQLEAALAASDGGRADGRWVGRRAGCERELRFVFERRALFELFEGHFRSGRFPVCILHGDTKLNNVLFDKLTGRARTVVDLDTCMPGFALYDFGDMVRFTAATSAEDEPDTTRAGTDIDVYRALRSGYLDHAADLLTPLEIELLPLAGRLVSLLIGARFLADYLNGDVYFGVTREHHNLQRARVQLAQVASMEAQAEALRATLSNR